MLRARLSPCSGMPWFVPLVRDFDGDGRDDLLLGCSNKLAVSLGAGAREAVLAPAFQHGALDRLIYSAAQLSKWPAPAFLVAGNKTGVVIVEAARGEASSRRVEIAAWRDEELGARAASVRLLDDGGALAEGVVYAAGPGALVELEWRRAGDEAGALHERRSWPAPPVGEPDRLALVDLHGAGEPSLVLLAHPRVRTNKCRLVMIEWPTRLRAGRLELGAPREHVIERACASVPISAGDEPGVALRLEGGSVGLARLDGDRVDVQPELAPLATRAGRPVEHTEPLALLTQRARAGSSRQLCARVLVRELVLDADRVVASAGSLLTYRVEDGDVTGVRATPLPDGFELGAVARGDFDGDGRDETLLVDGSYPQHIVSRYLGHGCEGPMDAPTGATGATDAPTTETRPGGPAPTSPATAGSRPS